MIGTGGGALVNVLLLLTFVPSYHASPKRKLFSRFNLECDFQFSTLINILCRLETHAILLLIKNSPDSCASFSFFSPLFPLRIIFAD